MHQGRWSPPWHPGTKVLGRPVRTRILWLEGNQSQCILMHRLAGLRLNSAYHYQEKRKQWSYEQHVWEVERGSFPPLLFSTSGSMGVLAATAYKKLAALLVSKWKQQYMDSIIMAWLQCHLLHSLLRSAVRCMSEGSAHSDIGQVVQFGITDPGNFLLYCCTPCLFI